MIEFHIEPAALRRLDEIHDYTCRRWGQEQAEHYMRRLFDCFEEIAARRMVWRTIPPAFGVAGYFCRCEHHYIYWKVRGDQDVAIFSILHERMHQADWIIRDAEA